MGLYDCARKLFCGEADIVHSVPVRSLEARRERGERLRPLFQHFFRQRGRAGVSCNLHLPLPVFERAEHAGKRFAVIAHAPRPPFFVSKARRRKGDLRIARKHRVLVAQLLNPALRVRPLPDGTNRNALPSFRAPENFFRVVRERELGIGNLHPSRRRYDRER